MPTAALRIVSSSDADYQTSIGAFLRRVSALPQSAEDAARSVIHQVRNGGDAAVRELTLRFEKRALTALELPRAEWDAQAAQVAPAVRAALQRAADRIRTF